MKKIFKWITIISILMPTVLVLPVFHIYKSNNKSEDFINSMTSDQTTNQLIVRLNDSISKIKERISEIKVKINELSLERKQVESFLRRNLEQENEILSKNLEEKLRLVEDKIKALQKEVEDKQALIHEKEQKINDLKSQITTLKEFFSNTWNKNIKDTVWAGETFSSLLNRFNKIISGISDFEFELENESLADTLIDNLHNSEGKFKVKKSNLKIQFDFGEIFPLTKIKLEKGNELVEFGWNENGKIEGVGTQISKVPKHLPWFITDLSNAFQNNVNSNIEGLTEWDTSKVTNMSRMFNGAHNFNQPLGDKFDTSNVKNMEGMFRHAKAFNQALGDKFNTSNVENMRIMFYNAHSFNQPLGDKFNTSKVENMRLMFYNNRIFNQSLGNRFNTSQVTDMTRMFHQAWAFNQSLGDKFDTSNVKSMESMFDNAHNFNQPLGDKFNTSKVENVSRMFENAKSFNQNISNWDLNNDTIYDDFNKFTNKDFTYDKQPTLIAKDIVQELVKEQLEDKYKCTKDKHCNVLEGDTYNDIIDQFNKDINIKDLTITSIKGHRNEDKFTGNNKELELEIEYEFRNRINSSAKIQINNIRYHSKDPVYSPDGKELLEFGYFKNNEGKWQIKPIDKKVNKVPEKLPEFITILDQAFEHNENETITGIEKWDTSNVTSMFKMFAETPNFNQDLNNFNTSQVTKMRSMFYKAHKFNKPLNNFDTSKVIDISHMFYEAYEFNQEINHFNTSRVIDMRFMFYHAHKFNKPIGNWDTSKVENMQSMFYGTHEFNQDINTKIVEKQNGEKYTAWNVLKVTTMRWMFGHTWSFNQDISNWDTQKVTNVFSMFQVARAFNQDLSKWKLSEDLKEYKHFNHSGHKDFDRQKLPHSLVITQYVKEVLEPRFKDKFHKQMTYQEVEDKIREFNNSSGSDVKFEGIVWDDMKSKLKHDITRVRLKFKFKGYTREIYMAIGKLLDTPPKK